MALRARAIPAACLLALACGRSGPDFTLHDTAVVVDSAAPFTRTADFPSRIESTVDAALAYWGGGWHHLAGNTVELTDEPFVTCGPVAGALGCRDGSEIRLTTRDPGTGTVACVEQTVLVHEIGHAVLGDPRHEDPRWMQLGEVADRLQGRVGYTDAGQVPCVISVSVWRHLLGTP